MNHISTKESVTKSLQLRISVEKLNSNSFTIPEILNKVKEGIDSFHILTTEWESPSQNVLIANASSMQEFESYYQGWFPLWDFIQRIESSQNVAFADFFPKEWSEDPLNEHIFLILKYQSRLKKPMRANYQYFNHFNQILKNLIYYEEIEDGFLWFYKRPCDFIQDHMDRLSKEGLVKWLQFKKSTMPKAFQNAILENFYKTPLIHK